jgi:hypothetical protein
VGAARRTGILGGAAAAFAFALPAAAVAAPPEPVVVDDPVQVVDNFCGEKGLTVELTLTVEGRFRFRPHGQGGLAYYHENSRATTTFARVENGTVGPVVATAVDRIVDKDLRVTDNGDGTLTVLALSTGGSTLYDAAGRPIARNPGQVRYELLVDTGGTPTDPSDDEVIADLGLVKGSTGRSDDYCAALVPALLG